MEKNCIGSNSEFKLRSYESGLSRDVKSPNTVHVRDHGKKRSRDNECNRERNYHGKNQETIREEENRDRFRDDQLQQVVSFPEYGYAASDQSFADNNRRTVPMMNYNFMASWGVNHMDNIGMPQNNLAINATQPVITAGLEVNQNSCTSVNPYAYMGMSGDTSMFGMMGIGNYYPYGMINGQYDYECQQREVRLQLESDCSEPRTSPPIVRYSDCEAAALSEKLRRKESFQDACLNLTRWLQRGEFNKRNSEKFYSMIQITNSHIRRLTTEKSKFVDELIKAKSMFNKQMKGILLQFDEICKLFKAAQAKKVWDHFTKAQRKYIELSKKQAEEIREAHAKEVLNDRVEDEMELSDDDLENDDNAVKQTGINLEQNNSKVEEQIQKLQKENSDLRLQIQAVENEIEIIKRESKKSINDKDKEIENLKLRFKQQCEDSANESYRCKYGRYETEQHIGCQTDFDSGSFGLGSCASSSFTGIQNILDREASIIGKLMIKITNVKDKEIENLKLIIKQQWEDTIKKPRMILEQNNSYVDEQMQKLKEEIGVIKEKNKQVINSKDEGMKMLGLQLAVKQQYNDTENNSYKCGKYESGDCQASFGSDLCASSNFIGSQNILEKEARIISILSAFLNVHPFGANLHYICSYLHMFDSTIKSDDLVNLLFRFPTIFREDTTGIGANLEKVWKLIVLNKN